MPLLLGRLPLPCPYALPFPFGPWKLAGRSPQPFPVGRSSESLLPLLPCAPFTIPAQAAEQITADTRAVVTTDEMEWRMRSPVCVQSACDEVTRSFRSQTISCASEKCKMALCNTATIHVAGIAVHA